MRSRYQRAFRRMLLDMHIPDWDPAFLSRYDPAQLAERYQRAGVAAVMLYCKSHVGLCYWPTPHGRVHSGLRGRDVVGELLAGLQERGIATCAYYSVVFDNWAAEVHPDWRQRTVAGLDLQNLFRYGWCCLNHPAYRAYERAQIDDLVARYAFDALFLDMPFWPLICACDQCRERYRREDAGEIPEVIDWTSAAWCRFQAARERWSSDLIAELRAVARARRPELGFYHNLSPALANWTFAQPLAASALDDFIGGDLYGDRVEQLVVSKLMSNLTETRPAEFMTSRCVNLADHVRLKRTADMTAQASAATALSSAFLFIDAIDPIGTTSAGVYERIGAVFAATAAYEPFLGGDPIEDIGVYFSIDSQMDFAENGTPVLRQPAPSVTYPHLRAVRGACRLLQRAHLPFGVITRRQLASLGRYRVLVLANVLRLDAEEVAAVRAYVRAGGRVYASRYTSLVSTGGTRHEDFQLADVLGCHFAGEEQGPIVYLRPAEPALATALAPQDYVSQAVGEGEAKPPGMIVAVPFGCGMPRLSQVLEGHALATLTLPYGYPHAGTAADRHWSSVHSSPPWEDTDIPVVVENSYGSGRAVYSTFDLERTDAEANETLFLHLIRSLLPGSPAFAADTHPAVWVNAFDQPESSRVMISLLNYQAEQPPAPVPVRLTVRRPTGRRFTSLRRVPEDRPLAYRLGDDGALHAELDRLELLAMLLAEYAAV